MFVKHYINGNGTVEIVRYNRAIVICVFVVSVFTVVLIQSKPVYSNHFFAAKNGKKEPIVRKTRC